MTLGALIIVYIMFAVFAKRQKRKQYKTAEAKVAEIKALPARSEKEKAQKYPVVSFTVEDTDIKTELFDLACDEDREPLFAEGDTIMILYEPHRPDRAFPADDLRIKKPQLITGAVVALLTIAAGIVITQLDLYK